MALMKDYWVFGSVLLVALLSSAGNAMPYPILAPLFMDGQVNDLNSFMGIVMCGRIDVDSYMQAVMCVQLIAPLRAGR